MAAFFSFGRGVEIGERPQDNKWRYRPGRDGIPTVVMVDPVKKKLWFAFANAYSKARKAPDEALALDELEAAVVAAFQEARNAQDEALALQKKEELEADRAVATDMVAGADERRGKKNEIAERKRKKRSRGADVRKVKKNEMAERKRKKRSPGADERRVKNNEMAERKVKIKKHRLMLKQFLK